MKPCGLTVIRVTSIRNALAAGRGIIYDTEMKGEVFKVKKENIIVHYLIRTYENLG